VMASVCSISALSAQCQVRQNHQWTVKGRAAIIDS
jgi:hypothetical protein